jgi:catechol 2,3-dioxygenase-like lactoylglutathione lyase family enzyme
VTARFLPGPANSGGTERKGGKKVIKKVAFIGHPVRDMARAKKFYGEILGLEKSLDYEDKWCEFDTPEGKSIALDTFSPEGTTPYLALETDRGSRGQQARAARDRARARQVLIRAIRRSPGH